MTVTIAVIQFPGSNCEYETAEAVRSAGATVDIIRWNVSEEVFSSYDGYVLPGGFSYQDRIRAGAISSKLPVLKLLRKASEEGKPILGICNGCQILAESGLVPDQSGDHKIEMALAPNVSDDKPSGFICDWVYVKPSQSTSSLFFSKFTDGDVLPIPVNHGEGRFLFSLPYDQLQSHSQFQYCDAEGNESLIYPEDPNGSTERLAGITNAKGNVLAMMPHPERAAFLKQIPRSISHEWGDQKRSNLTGSDQEGPWALLFSSMVSAIKEGA